MQRKTEMKESEKIIRFFVIATIWILFVTVTLAGLVTAAEKTEYINRKQEDPGFSRVLYYPLSCHTFVTPMLIKYIIE
jgi:hypothetical protein